MEMNMGNKQKKIFFQDKQKQNKYLMRLFSDCKSVHRIRIACLHVSNRVAIIFNLFVKILSPCDVSVHISHTNRSNTASYCYIIMV